MKAAQVNAFGRPETVIEIVEQADPGEPGADEVVVDAEFAPINPADILNLEGQVRCGATGAADDRRAPKAWGGSSRPAPPSVT